MIERHVSEGFGNNFSYDDEENDVWKANKLTYSNRYIGAYQAVDAPPSAER